MMDRRRISPTMVDDLILPPEYSDAFCKDLTWLVHLFDCEIKADVVVVKGQIICQGTKKNLENIRCATTLFYRKDHDADEGSSTCNNYSHTYFKDEVFIPNDRVHKLLGEEGKLLRKKIISSVRVTIHKTHSHKSTKSRFIILGRCRDHCLKVKALLKSIIGSSAPQSPSQPTEEEETKKKHNQKQKQYLFSPPDESNKENIPVSGNNLLLQEQSFGGSSTTTSRGRSVSSAQCCLLPSLRHQKPKHETNCHRECSTSHKEGEICHMTIHYWPQYVRTLRYTTNNEDGHHGQEHESSNDMMAQHHMMTSPPLVKSAVGDDVHSSSPKTRHSIMIEDITEANFTTVQEKVLKPFTLFSFVKTTNGSYFFSTDFQNNADAVLFARRYENIGGLEQKVYKLQQTFDLPDNTTKKTSSANANNITTRRFAAKSSNYQLLVRHLTPIMLCTTLHVISQCSGTVSIWKKSCGMVAFMLEIRLDSMEDAKYCEQVIEVAIKTEGEAVVEYVDSTFDMVRI